MFASVLTVDVSGRGSKNQNVEKGKPDHQRTTGDAAAAGAATFLLTSVKRSEKPKTDRQTDSQTDRRIDRERENRKTEKEPGRTDCQERQ